MAKGIAGDQREERLAPGSEDGGLGRWDDTGRFHVVRKNPSRRFQLDMIAWPQGTETAEVEIPVPGDDAVPWLPGKRGAGEVARGLQQVSGPRAFDDGNLQVHPGDSKPGDGAADGRRPARCCRTVGRDYFFGVDGLPDRRLKITCERHRQNGGARQDKDRSRERAGIP